ncbi:MAG: DUF6263 family protein [Phycisphaerales bacterium]
MSEFHLPHWRSSFRGVLGCVAAVVAISAAPLIAAGPAISIDRDQPAAAEPVSLAMRLKPGWTLSQELTSTNRVQQTMQGMQTDFSSTMIIDFTHRVRPDAPSLEGGVVAMESVITRMRLDLTMPMQAPIRADSADVEALAGSPQAAMIRPMFAVVGVPMRYELTADGGLLKTAGLDEILIGLPGQGSPAAMLLGQLIPKLPKAPVSTGDAWKQTVPAEPPLPGEVEVTWTMQKLKGSIVVTDLESTVTLENEDIEPQPGMMATITMNGTQRGTADIDVQTGWMTRLESTQSMSGSITLNGGPVPTVVPMTSTAISKLRTVPAPSPPTTAPATPPAAPAAPGAVGG